MAAGTGEPGSPTPKQARGRRWRRCGRNLFVPSDLGPISADQRIVEAVSAAPGCAATGWAALHWMGAGWFDGTNDVGDLLPIPLATGDRRGVDRRAGAVVSEDWLFDEDVVVVDGLPVTVPERSVSWEVRRARWLPRAVRTIDMAAFDDLIDLETMGEYVAKLPSRPGVKLLRAALALADENVWSPMESEMRLLWQLDGHHAKPLCNAPIFDRRGNHLLTPDLFDPATGVGGEYNGGVHDGDEPRRRDLDREEIARSVGIELVPMMAGDRRQPDRFLRRLRAAYRRAADRSGTGDRWTLDQPDWWVDTSTVGARRSLSPAEREMWLRRRR